MILNSQQEEETPTAQQQLHSAHKPTTALSTSGGPRSSVSASWSRADCLFRYEFIQLQAEDTINSIILPYSWRLNTKNGPNTILTGLQNQIDNWRLFIFLQMRDECRDELIIPRPPKWTGTTSALGVQVYDVFKTSLPQASHIVADMGNQAQASHPAEEGNEDSTCSSCQDIYVQQH